MPGTLQGSRKTAAQQVGLSESEYEARIEREKWCTACKAWHPRDRFGSDRSRSDGLDSRCRTCKRLAGRVSNPTPYDQRRKGGRTVPARDGDVRQARSRVNYRISKGEIPSPNALSCTDCGHIWALGERRHEYDHHLGYAAEHQFDVEAVCVTCHRARDRARGRQR